MLKMYMDSKSNCKPSELASKIEYIKTELLVIMGLDTMYTKAGKYPHGLQPYELSPRTEKLYMKRRNH